MIESQSSTQINYNFISYEDKKQAFTNVNSSYSLAIDFFSTKLNKLHNIEKSKLYWEIIIGRWLKEICLIHLDRSTSLKKESDEALDVIYRDFKQNFSIAEDYSEFYRSSESDLVEGKVIFSKLFFKEKENFLLNKKIQIRHLKNISFLLNFFLSLYKFIFNLLHIINKGDLHLLSTEHISKIDKAKIFIKSKGKVFFYLNLPFIGSKEIFVSHDLRLSLLNDIKDSLYDSVHKELLLFLAISMPKSYVENFNYFQALQRINFINTPKTILLDTRFRTEDGFKIQLAEWVEKGSITRVLQHDVNSLLDFDSLFDADQIFKEYLFWNDPKLPPPLRINHFVEIHKSYLIEKSRVLHNDLYVCRAIPKKQSFSLAYTLHDAQLILEGRKEFSKLSGNLEKEILIRDRVNLLNDEEESPSFLESNKLKILSNNQDIHELFNKSRIVVFEGFSTGIFQCLAINKPFLLFLNKDYIDIRAKKIQLLIQELREMNIICSSPSQLVNSLSSDFLRTYETPVFQERLSRLTKSYTPISKDYLNDWIKFIRDSND